MACRSLGELSILVGDLDIASYKLVGISGCVISQYEDHRACKKNITRVEGVVKLLECVMINVGGPRSSRKKVLTHAAYSTILYAVSI